MCHLNLRKRKNSYAKTLITTKIILFLLILIVINNAIVFNQDKSKEIQKFVSVKNIEIIIRAMRNGHPVIGLKETDFILLENGKKMKITSLTEVSRKIGSNKIGGWSQRESNTSQTSIFTLFLDL